MPKDKDSKTQKPTVPQIPGKPQVPVFKNSFNKFKPNARLGSINRSRR